MFKDRLPLKLGLSLIFLAYSLQGMAQTIPDSGNILQDLQQKTVPSQLRPDTQREKPPESEVEDNQQKKQPPEQSPEQGAVKKVFIKSIHIDGITLLPADSVNKIVASYENRDNSFSELQNLTDTLTALYREEGYVTSRVYIPPQKLENGQLKLQAAEGRMGQLQVENGRYFKGRSVKYGMALKAGDPFNAEVLKKSLRQLNENPDRNVRAILKPGEHTGETDVQLQITDRSPIHLSPSIDNLGRPLIGDNRIGLKITNNNVLGLGDSLLASLSFTRRSFGIVDHYQVPVGSHGTKIGFDHAQSFLKLGEQLTPFDIKGSASTYSPFIVQDIVNKERYKVYADLAFDFKQMDTNISGQDFSHDLIRILRPGLNIEEYDAYGRTFIRNEIGLGLGIFGGSSGFQSNPDPSRLGAGSKLFRYTGSLIRTQKMPWNTYGVFRLIGQASPDRLVSAEQFQAGGAFTVRGYREGQVIGDSGILLSGEWRVPLFIIPHTWTLPFTNYNLRDNIQLISFVDYASIFVNKPATGVDRSESVLGTGLGLRFRLTRMLNGRLDLGYPLLNQGPDDTGARLHFGLESQIF